MKSVKKRVFTVNVLEEDKIVEKEFAVVLPSLKVQNDANRLRSKTFHKLLKEGVMLREELEKIMKERGAWNEEINLEFETLKREVLEGELTLTQGGISLNKARDIALNMKEKRERMISLLTNKSELDSQTCEGLADQDRFNFLFVNCLVYNDDSNTLYYKDLDEYLENADDPVAVKGATEFYYLISDSDPVDDHLPENKFLKEYDFVDDNLRLVEPSTNRLINADGKYIDEFGNFVKYNDDGSYDYVDFDGNKLDMTTGSYAVDEKKPFLDDDGKPIVKTKTKTPVKKRRTRKTKTSESDA